MSLVITLDLSSKVVDFSGAVGEQSYGEVIAEHVLARASKGPAVKMMLWAFKLHENQPIQMDEPDFKLLYSMVEHNEIICNFVKVPVMKTMDEAKTASEGDK